MKHPFGEILASNDGEEQLDSSRDSDIHNNESHEGETRRQHLKHVMQLGIGAMAAGVAGSALGQITTQAIGEEGADKRPPQGIIARPPMTKAGPGHPEHGGRQHPLQGLQEAARLLQQKKWSKAAPKLDRARGAFRNNKQLKETIEKLETSLKDLAAEALDKADGQAKAGDLVPALDVYRQADRLDTHYGLKERATEAIEELQKHELYPVALEKVKKLEAERNKPKPSTRALGEEGGPSTRRAGEEGGGLTTQAIGEEGGSTRARGEEGGATTLRVGEEGGGGVTTQAIGEEGGQRPKPFKIKDVPRVTTEAVGEEG